MEDHISFETAAPAEPTSPPPARPRKREQAEPELPPYSEACEIGVLGCCILDPKAVLDTVCEQLIKFQDSAFYDLRHKILFHRIRSMWEAGKEIDELTLNQSLTDSNELASIGGWEYVGHIIDQVPSTAMLTSYLKVVVEKATLRGVIKFGHAAIDLAKTAEEGADIVAQIQSEALCLTDQGSSDKLTSVAIGLRQFVEVLEKRKNGRQKITGIDTGMHMLNNMTCGLQAGEMTVIAARPSVGKTSFGQTISINALRAGLSVGFWSIEMGEASLIQRIVGSVSRIDSQKLRNGFISRSDEVKLLKGIEEIGGWKHRLYIDDRSHLTGRDFYTSVRRAQRENGISLAVVDYIQLMSASRRAVSREDEVADVADWIKRTAKDLKIAVIALAQLNKESEKDRTPREPRLGDIRESDRICQNADIVGLLWAPKLDENEYHDMKWIQYHVPDDPKELDTNKDEAWSSSPKITVTSGNDSFQFPSSWNKEFTFVQLSIAKNRDGPTGPCELVLQRRTTRFCDAYRPDYGRTAESKLKTVEGVEI